MRDKINTISGRLVLFCLFGLILTLPFTKAGMQFFAWSAIFFWLIKKICLHRNDQLLNNEINRSLLVFLIICALSTIFSYNFSLSFKALLTKVGKNILLFFVISSVINNRKNLKGILIAIIISATIMAVDAGFQFIKGADFLRNNSMYTSQLQASFNNPNSFGGWLIIIICIIFGIIKFNLMSTKIRVFLAFIISALLVCLIATQSRASWLGFIMSFIFINLYLLHKRRAKIKILFITVLIGIAIVTFMLLPQDIKIRISSIASLMNSNLFRVKLWQESLQIIQDFPLFGAGLNTYAKVGPYYAKAGGGYYPHNSYLQMAAEIGILGLSAFLWFIFKLFSCGLRKLKESKDGLLLGLLAAILAFLTQSFFDVNFYALQLATLFWFVLGLTMARINILNLDKVNPT